MTAVAVMRFCSGQGEEGGRRGAEGKDWGGSGWGGMQGEGGVPLNWYVLVYGERVYGGGSVGRMGVMGRGGEEAV